MNFTSYPTLWPLLVYSLAVIALAVIMLLLSHFLGERHKEEGTDDVYEAGIKVTGSARLNFPIHFYVIAMFFVIFDLEAIFVVAWAISAESVGWAGYIGLLIFAGVLLAVLVYELGIGALDFGPNGKRILKAYHKHKRLEEESERKELKQ